MFEKKVSNVFIVFLNEGKLISFKSLRSYELFKIIERDFFL